MDRKRYAIVGTGGRARSFYTAIARDHPDRAELVGLCDVNQTRMDYANRALAQDFDLRPVPTYRFDRFDDMVRTERPDIVIVTCIDRAHHRYICRAMELGCDVITEKPMTVDAAKCQRILDTIKCTGRRVRVTFNYRYQPASTKVCELLRAGVIGRIHLAHFEWLLDTSHGADYFRRWHRDKRNSGGLMVHKATHHFDLVNWWLDSRPHTVFAFGDLRFYGRANAEERGLTDFYYRSTGSPAAREDPFALDLSASERLRGLYLDAEHEDGYLRDQSVFGDGISIEDTMTVLVRYASGAMMSYSLVAYAPWEGLRIALTGDQGRLEVTVSHGSYVNAFGTIEEEGTQHFEDILVLPLHGKPYRVEAERAAGGHGGADPVLMRDLFGEPSQDPLGRAASHVDGAWSILTGIAANQAFATGRPVAVDDLVRF